MSENTGSPNIADVLKVEIGGKKYDLAAALPLTLGDFRRLKKDYGVTPEMIMASQSDVDTMFSLIAVVLRKVDKDLTDEQIETIPMVSVGPLMRNIALASQATDRPTSEVSTPSSTTTSGASEITTTQPSDSAPQS